MDTILKRVNAAVFTVFAAGAVLPLAAQAGSVTFKAPLAGATVSGTLSGSACEVSAGGASRVEFFLGSAALNVASVAPWRCGLITTQFSNGSYLLKAVAYDKRGKPSSSEINITIANNVAPPPPPPPPPPNGSTP